MSRHIGVISEGTLRTEDLLPAFADTLRDLCQSRPTNETTEAMALVEEADALASVEEWSADDAETARDVLAEMEHWIEEFAPFYTYFGTLEGDGACFGIWPAMDSINDLPTVEDRDAARALGEDCKSVSDHGNVTVYNGAGRVILEIV